MINTPQAPYYDDFNVEKNFLKILFKPKLSVQTRELEQLQSMFQNQVETLASQIFQNGSVISGGKFTFKERVNYVKLNNEYNSQTFNYNIYKDRYVYGTTTKIIARVFNGWNQSTNEVASLYLDYLNSGENQQQTFQPGEVLQLISKVYLSKVAGDINIGDTVRGERSSAVGTVVNINNNEYEIVFSTSNTFQTGEQVIDSNTSAYYLCTATESVIYQAQVKSGSEDAEAVGYCSAVYVDEGIYYIDGYFVHTGNQSKIISNYSTNTNARVGFEKEVEIITSNEDPSLLDNAAGYPNYNAPGADRLKINLVLDYYNLYETPSENFVEVLTIEDSSVTGNSSINQRYAEILDTMARRTYDESGNYTVKPFLIDIHEFLDDGTNNGIYKEEYFGYNTQSEALNASMKVFNLPSPGQSHVHGTKYYPYDTHENFLAACRNRLAIGVEPGKAYVMGYEIDHGTKTWLPILKARDTKVLNNSATNIFYGNYIRVNNLVGLPNIYKHQPIILSSASTFDFNNPTAGQIGTAKVYAIEVESGTLGSADCIYRVYIDDINMTTGTFSGSVNSIGAAQTQTDPADGWVIKFSAKPIKVNNAIVINNIDKTALVFPFEKSTIAGVSDASYDYKKIYTGSVDSSGALALSVDANARFLNPEEPKNYIITILSGSLAGNILNTASLTKSLDASGNLTFSGLPNDAKNQTYMVLATLHKTTDMVKTKTLYPNTEFVKASGPFNEIILNHADGYRLVGVYDSGNPATTPTTASTNITANYDFDNGQRDTYYDLARITLKEGAIAPTGQVLVVYDYFAHSSGDYFTVDSYPNIDYEDIPTYTNENGTYDLKNCIDLRGRIDENGDGQFNSSTLPYIMQNSSIFESDLSYYLPRLDVLELDYRGNFNIKYGTSSEDPQYPIGSINSMTLYYLAMPAYTESADDVVRIYCENKRYTMRDIGNLDDRITAIENYILMNTNELDTNNLQIYDVNGYQCIKTGFIVDVFLNHDYGDTTLAGYRCSVDPENAMLRPDYKLHVIDLEKSATRQSTVVEQSGLYMIPYTNKSYITNTVNTSYVPMNSNKIVEWEGNVVLGKTLVTVFNEVDNSVVNYGGSSQKLTMKIAKKYNLIHSSWIGSNIHF